MKYMRGIRFIAAIFVGILAFSQVACFYSPKIVRADTTVTMPADLPGLFTQYSTQINAAFNSNSVGGKNGTEWQLPLLGRSYYLTTPDDNSLQTNNNYIYQYYTKVLQGKDPSSVFMFQTSSWATSLLGIFVPDGNTTPESDTFYTIYDTTYQWVKNTDTIYRDVIQDVKTLADPTKYKSSDGTVDVASYTAQQAAVQAKITSGLIPAIANVYGGVNALKILSNNTKVKNQVIAQMGGDANAQTAFSILINDLDYSGGYDDYWAGQGASLGTLGGPLASPVLSALGKVIGAGQGQNSMIFKPQNLTEYLAGSKTQPGYVNGHVYPSTAAFYQDFKTILGPILTTTAPKTAADVQAMQAALASGAKTADATQNSVAAAGAANNQYCGSSSGTDIVKAIQGAICAVAVLGATINQSLLAVGVYTLAKMVPFHSDVVPTGSSGIGNFVANLVPKELTPGFIIDNLNRLAVVNSTANLLIRILGSFVVFMLVIVALANILQIQVNTYAIKKALPALIIGYLLAYGGVYATKVCIEFSNNLATYITSPSLNGNQELTVDCVVLSITNLSSQGTATTPTAANTSNTGTTKTGSTTGAGAGATTTAGSTTQGCNGVALNTINSAPILTMDSDKNSPDMNKILQQLVLNLFVLVVVVMILILAFLFVFRSVVFFILTPLAPLAFFGITVDLFKPVWTRWWKTAQGWIFMNCVSAFWVWLMIQFFRVGGNVTTGTAQSVNFLSGIISYALGVTCLYFAITTPFKMAGELKGVMDKTAGAAIKYGTNAAKKGAKDEFDMRWGRIKGGNNPIASVTDFKHKLTEQREKNVEYGKKGLNYKSIEKDGKKLADISTTDNELAGIEKAIASKMAEIDKLTAIDESVRTPEQNEKLLIASSEYGLLLENEKEKKLRRTRLEGSLSRGSKANRKNIERSMFHSKHEEVFKENEELLKSSTQARVASSDHHFREMDGELRDMKASKDELAFIEKSELNEAYRSGAADHDDPNSKLAKERHFRDARVDSGKRIEEDSAKKDKVFSAMEFVTAAHHGEIAITDPDMLKGQLKNIGGYIEDEYKKPKGYTKGDKKMQKQVLNGDHIHPDKMSTSAGQMDVLESITSVARMYHDATSSPRLENKDTISAAFDGILTICSPTDKALIQDIQAELNDKDKTKEDKEVKALVNAFKALDIGKTLKGIWSDPEEVLTRNATP